MMSDPVTNSEVEDVLSSIRRLVGEARRPVVTPPAMAAPDRLVLTPQLRVSDHDVLRLEPEDEVRETEGWYEFEEPPLLEVPKSADADQQSFQAVENVAPKTLDAEPEEDHVEAHRDAPEYDCEDDSEDLAGFSFARPEFRRESGEGVQTPTRDLEPAADDADEGDADAQATDTDVAQSDFSGLTAKIAALETAIAQTRDQWEPDGEEDDPYAGTRSPRLRWLENVDLDGRGTPLRLHEGAEAATLSEDARPNGQYSDEQIIDEDMLRDLVFEIVQAELETGVVAEAVRKELQGELGERITRNVRKLVRREIQRALAASGLT